MNSHTTVAPANLVLRQARLLDPANARDEVTDVGVLNGILTEDIEQCAGHPDCLDIDANGLWLLPGAVDLCARLCEPGLTHKGTIASETLAAAKGGVSHVCCPPDTLPIIDTPAVANQVQEIAHQVGFAQVMPWGALTKNLEGELLSEMFALQEAGCVGVTQLRHNVRDNKILLRCLEYAATFDLTVMFQCQDPALAENGVAHAGSIATRLGLSAIPRSAETIALCRNLELVEQTGVKAHFGQLSCARSVALIADAQQRGLPVTADVASHQLWFTDQVLEGFASVHHVQPPYRAESDRQALLQGLQDGVISAICSDHQPHEAAAKAAPFPVTAPGVSGLETLLPSSYQWVVNNQLDFTTWVHALTQGPAHILGITAGHLNNQHSASLTLFDPKGHTDITSQHMASAGHNSPWLNQTLPGEVLLTVSERRITYRHRRLLG